MTKINKYTQLYDMSLHDAEAVNTLFNNLNHGYSTEIKVRAKQKGIHVSGTTIRNVRSGAHKNSFIFSLLIELAKEQQAEKQRLKKSIEEISV